MSNKLRIAFFGSSLVSAYWNGAATYYRGIVRALHQRGHHVTFYEPDALQRQAHRDIDAPDWARVVVYATDNPRQLYQCLEEAQHADLIIKASGVGAYDAFLEAAVLHQRTADNQVIFWDVDAPATLERLRQNPHDPFIPLIPQYDLVLTYGGGDPVVQAYARLGARQCVPIYNALDPTTHHPVEHNPKFRCDLALLANRLPDREQRIDAFFFEPARQLANRRFCLGGSGWDNKAMPRNVRYLGHVYTADHNPLNATALTVLNVNRASMARLGFSPPTRLFEAAGAGACIITDAWDGINHFLEPDRELLVANDGEEVAAHLCRITPEYAERIGRAALDRVRREHTYQHRVRQLEETLGLDKKTIRENDRELPANV